MSNKRQLKMSASSKRVTFILCCDLKRVLGLNFVCILLLLVTSATLIVESAKLESQNENSTETVTKSTKSSAIKIATNDDDNNNNYKFNDNNQHYHSNLRNDKADEALILRQQQKHNTLDEAAENFYHKELQRLSYDTIHSILRDENEPIFRREDNDRRYYHAKSLQPTHEIMKREATEFTTEAPSTATATATTTTKNHLKLKTNNVMNLSSKSLKVFNITAYESYLTLNLSHNQLKALPISENSKIELLDLNSNHIETANAPLNNHLKTLFLSGNQIENLAALNLSQLIALETLDLSCNHIKNLETSFFPQLMRNLKFLNLAYNRLGTISRETFYNLFSLNTLLLAHNNITNIDYETFLSLPNLQYLDLSHNQLKGESVRALQGIPDLVGLSIAYNPEMGESLQEFVASWSLKEVDASGTGLCKIPAALAQAVRTLKLADNWLKIINCGDLDSYPLLTHLDLSNSHIEDIEDDAMGRLEFLELLFLDHNRLRKVPVSLPTSLEHLFLQDNEIMDLQVQAFQGLKNLKTLDLSHNKLLYLPALPLPKLLTLNLQASGLQGLNQAIVHTLPHLRDLLLEENPIKCSDLLGIAEWASPCRIAERMAMNGGGGVGVGVSAADGVGVFVADATTSKTIDSEQIANIADLGQKLQQQQQQQLQTVAKIDLKAKFVQTYNFYEKFGGSDAPCRTGVCNVCIVTTKTIATTKLPPPTCAIEFEDEFVLKVEKPTLLTETGTTAAPTAKKFAVEQPNVNFNEHHKLAQVEKSTASNAPTNSNVAITKSMGIMENANHAAAAASLTTKMPTTKTFQTKNVVIANVTSAGVALDVPTATVVMPTTFSAINSTEKITKISQTAAEPTISMTTTVASTTTTSTLTMTATLNKNSKESATKTPNLKLLLPETMTTQLTTKKPTKMPTSSSTTIAATTSKPIALSTILSTSLLEHQQQQLMTTTFETLLTSTAAAATTTTKSTETPTTYQTENLAGNIGNTNDSQKILQQRKSLDNFEHVNDETKNKSFSESSKSLPATKLTTTTTIGPPHKHVTLQLNSKDRHLIGTPLLTHHGQNLMVAAEELKKNGNHIAAKTVTTTTTNSIPELTTASTTNIQKQQLDKSQNQQTEKEVNKFTKVHDAENVVETLTSTTTTPITTSKATTTTTLSNIKLNKKQLNEQKKKPTTLIMKKMTITTTATKQQPHQQQITSTNSPKSVDDNSKALPHQQHHYSLNTPHENEATLNSDSVNNFMASVEQKSLQSQAAHQQYQSYNVKHHSTVNTPVINGHEMEPQTFQEHNEIEEAAAAVAARASTSAKFNSKLHAHDAKWSSVHANADDDNDEDGHKHMRRLHFDNPTVVFIVGMALFVTLVLSLLHAYRCKMPTIFNMHRQQQLHQRPHRQQRGGNDQQGQQMGIRNKNSTAPTADGDDDDYDGGDSRSSFLNSGSNQFQRQWRLERAYSQPSQQQQQPQIQQHQFKQQQQQQQQSSPFHNLQVRELQQTSAIEPHPRYCKPTYNISNALGERSNSHTSSSCSPHSSCTFDDETCYIEMTTDVGQPIAMGGVSNAVSITQHTGDLLPMELLSVTRRDFNDVNAAQLQLQQRPQHQHQQHQHQTISKSQALHTSPAFQTSAIDESSLEDIPVNQDVSNTKLTPRTRKLGLW